MPAPHDIPDEAPPILGSWRNVYFAVLFYLAGVIGVFYWFTRHFAQ